MHLNDDKSKNIDRVFRMDAILFHKCTLASFKLPNYVLSAPHYDDGMEEPL